MISLITLIFIFAFFTPKTCATSLKCLGHEDLTTGQLSSCSFTLNKNQLIQDDAQLTQAPISCQMITADANIQKNDDDGFCFVEVILNDNAETKMFSFSAEGKQESKTQTYLGIMGVALTNDETIQYATYLNFETDEMELSLRIQCRTEDNCAWKILKTILYTMLNAQSRWANFKLLKDAIFTKQPDPTKPLICNAPGQNNLVTCTPNERQCYVNVSGANPISMGCVDPNTVINSQFESQQNYLKPIELKTHQQTPTFRRLKFACRLNHCNSIVMEPRINSLVLAFFLPAKTSNNPNGGVSANANAAMIFSPNLFSILSTIIFIKM